MDPTQVAAMLQGTQGGGGAPSSPQALATIQNLMKNPGGLGAMQPPPNQMQAQPMAPPQAGAVQSAGQMNPQAQNMSAGAMQQPMQNQQQLMQLLNTQPQPISP